MGQMQLPPIDRSFIVIAAELSAAEALSLYAGQTYVVITHEQQPYVLQGKALKRLAGRDAQQSLLAGFIHTGQIAPSPVCQPDEVIERDIDWSQFVLIADEEDQHRNGYAGIVSPAAMVRYWKAERERLAAYLHTLAETVNDAVTAVDKDGKVLYWNRAAEETYGIARENIVGRTIGEHFRTESIMLYGILDEGREVRQVYHQPTADKHVLINASPIIENGAIIGGVATEHDITRIVRLNEELYAAPLWTRQERLAESVLEAAGVGLQQAIRLARKVAPTDSPVLLIGEPGSETEMIARLIHESSKRKDGPLLTLNCAAYPAGALESELFGYQGGAFSGTDLSGKPGRLEAADGGTLLIEDIDEMSPELQLKLFQYIEEGQLQRVGANQPIGADTRIIASATAALYDKWKDGRFHNALYYKLHVAQIGIPPLRERTTDIPGLMTLFLREFSAKYQKPLPKLPTPVMTALFNYEWPGNLRELQQIAERLVLLHDNGVVTLNDLPSGIVEDEKVTGVEPFAAETLLHARGSAQQEAALIEEALAKTYGNKSAAAKLLGISRGTLYNKMKELNLG